MNGHVWPISSGRLDVTLSFIIGTDYMVIFNWIWDGIYWLKIDAFYTNMLIDLWVLDYMLNLHVQEYESERELIIYLQLQVRIKRNLSTWEIRNIMWKWTVKCEHHASRVVRTVRKYSACLIAVKGRVFICRIWYTYMGNCLLFETYFMLFFRLYVRWLM